MGDVAQESLRSSSGSVYGDQKGNWTETHELRPLVCTFSQARQMTILELCLGHF
jgi:hypothetical protein